MLGIPESEVFRTAELCDRAASLPLTLLDCPHFRVDLWELKTETFQSRSSWELMLWMLDGAPLRVTAGGKTVLLETSACFAIPAGTDYCICSDGVSRFLCYYVETDAQGQFKSVSKVPENVQKKQALVPHLTPFRLEDMGTFQDDEVVIHNIYLTPKVKCNVMFFDKGQQVGPHGRPFDGWITVLDGDIRFQIGENEYMLHPGDSLKMPADIVHTSFAEQGRAKYQIIVIRKEG